MLSETISDYPVVSQDKVRYGDTDRQGHVNNAVFSTYLETGRVELLHTKVGDLADSGCAFVIVRLELDFVSELHWPGTVEIGTRVRKVGNSSATLEQAVFQQGRKAAAAVSVIVQMDDATRKARPLSLEARERLMSLMRPAEIA